MNSPTRRPAPPEALELKHERRLGRLRTAGALATPSEPRVSRLRPIAATTAHGIRPVAAAPLQPLDHRHPGRCAETGRRTDQADAHRPGGLGDDDRRTRATTWTWGHAPRPGAAETRRTRRDQADAHRPGGRAQTRRTRTDQADAQRPGGRAAGANTSRGLVEAAWSCRDPLTAHGLELLQQLLGALSPRGTGGIRAMTGRAAHTSPDRSGTQLK
ncbi:hypothetical protein FA95DRAFT_1574014 [Auriscalpium vulgare]|uniref:Uncharacterized protein n=1 Tax=Auriscalpium vulgare TaxID=40419 RepID=A0ACB8RLT1_9AGAM|nr:hypothetical protein FA95DRAFT_1574014 [Auriscalpium vulgare]